MDSGGCASVKRSFLTGKCRTYGAESFFAGCPSPYGLGYVLSRLRRFGLLIVDLEFAHGYS